MLEFDNITIGLKAAVGVGVSAIIFVSSIIYAYDGDQGKQDKKIHNNKATNRVLQQRQDDMDKRLEIQQDLYALQYELNKRLDALPPDGSVSEPTRPVQ